MALEERPISSEQMYRIEDNGYSIFGMKKLLMMENAGHGLADFILSEKGPHLDGKKIISFCGTGNNGGEMLWLHQDTYQVIMVLMLLLCFSETPRI